MILIQEVSGIPKLIVCPDYLWTRSWTKEAMPSHVFTWDTRCDHHLSKVMRYTQFGWPDAVGPALKPFYKCRDELTVEGKYLLWGMRVIIPPSYQRQVLQDLHQEHGGMTHLKSVARSYVWWPNLDFQIEV